NCAERPMERLIESQSPPVSLAVAMARNALAELRKSDRGPLADQPDGTNVASRSAATPRVAELRIQVVATSSRFDDDVGTATRTPAHEWSERPRAGFAGIVDAVSADVTGLSVGDEIFGITDADSLWRDRDAMTISARVVAKKPRRLSSIEAASLCQ